MRKCYKLVIQLIRFDRLKKMDFILKVYSSYFKPFFSSIIHNKMALAIEHFWKVPLDLQWIASKMVIYFTYRYKYRTTVLYEVRIWIGARAKHESNIEIHIHWILAQKTWKMFRLCALVDGRAFSITQIFFFFPIQKLSAVY